MFGFEKTFLDGKASLGMRVPLDTLNGESSIPGAGLTGQSAAYHLGQDTLLLDRKDALDGQLMAAEDPSTLKTADARSPIKGKIELNAAVVRVLARDHIVALRDGRRFRYDDLVSTMPLPELIKAIGEEVPQELRSARDLEACRRWLKQFDIVLAGLPVQAQAQAADADQALQAGKLSAQAVLAKRARAQKAGAE